MTTPNPLFERKFTLVEAVFLMLTEMSSLDVRSARQSWKDMGAPVEVFDRLHARFLADGVLMTHPRKTHQLQTGKLYEAVGDYYAELLAHAALVQMEAVNGTANR